MASAIIHLCVAKKVNEILKMDEKMLSLGAIAPDISKIIGESKNKSHFLDQDPEYSIPNDKRFYKKYQTELTKPFEMGYFIHLLTDKYWFRDYINRYIDEYTTEKYIPSLSYTAMKSLIYNDYTRLNSDLVSAHNLDLYLFANEITYPKSKITEIPIDKLPLVVEKMGLIIKNMDTQKPLMLNLNRINEFIDECTANILIDLKNYNLI